MRTRRLLPMPRVDRRRAIAAMALGCASALAPCVAAVRAALERYVATLEALSREAPYNWFNFYDFWADATASPAADAAG